MIKELRYEKAQKQEKQFSSILKEICVCVWGGGVKTHTSTEKECNKQKTVRLDIIAKVVIRLP